MTSRFITLFVLLLCFFLYTPEAGQAQLVGISENDVSIGISPENPGPRDPVTVTIETYSFNLDTANTKWYVNNNLAQEGKGLKTLTFQTGNLGQTSSVRIVIDSEQGQVIKNISINPSIVTIVWEADTYTPPFFKGKSLFSHQSTITFMAQPQILVGGRVLNPTNLIYTWSKDGTVLGSQNGYSKQTLTLTGSVISRSMKVMVDVQDPTSGATASGIIQVNPVEPEILMYIADPLYGIQYNKAMKGTFSLTEREVTLTTVPYFFTTTGNSGENSVSYNWSINGNTISDGQNTRTRVFRKVGELFGVSSINVRAIQENKILQFASQNLAIDFLKDSSQ